MRSSTRSFWKRGIAAIGVTLSTLAVAIPASAQGISVYVDGSPVNFAGVPPTNQGGRVLVPLRGVFEALGAVVDYNAPTRTIDALRGNTRLRLTIGSSIAFVNDQAVRLDVPAQVSLGRTLVPLRFVGEALGATVNWNAASQSVIISSPVTVPTPYPTPQPTPVPTPLPTPIPPVYEQPVSNTVTGTVVRVDNFQPRTITIRVNNVSRTYELATNADLVRRPLTNNSTPSNPQFGTATTISTSEILAGETVELALDAGNRVTQVTTMPAVYVARIRSTTGNRIILDDANSTQLTIGQNMRFIDPQGRETTTANLQQGDEVVLFISPDTRRIYQVSSHRNDLYAATGRDVNDPYLPPTGQPGGTDYAQIDLVTFTTSNQNPGYAKAGDTISITVRGTEGLRGTFDLSPRVVNRPLAERPRRAGEYFATYVVRPGDDVTNGRITVRLTGRNNEETTQQSLDDITIDTIAPVVIGTNPTNGATINITQPNIVIYAEELGSGLAPSSITIRNQGQTFDAFATVAPPMSLRAVSPRALSGRVDVSAEIRDEAGNSTTTTFWFNAGTGTGTGTGAIQSVFHNANRVLQVGDRITVDMIAEPGGRASFDLRDANNRVVALDVAMTEIARGRYRGDYTVQARDLGAVRVIGRFRDADGRTTTAEASTDIDIVDGTTNNFAPTITQPSEGATVGEQITVRGRGVAGNIVEVSIRAEGTQFYVLPYNVELGTSQVRVSNNGEWQTQTITLPRPRNVSGLRYIITARQTDTANRTSDATTVTVRAQ